MLLDGILWNYPIIGIGAFEIRLVLILVSNYNIVLLNWHLRKRAAGYNSVC